MIDLEHKLGPMRIRAWGLVVNLLANIALLVGLANVIRGSGGWGLLITGAAITMACLVVLAAPAREN